MGLFGFNNFSSGNDDLAVAPKAGDGKLYKWVQLAAISVFLIAAVLVIIEIFGLLKMGTTANGMVFSVGVIGLGGLSALPWVRVLESFKDKRYKITSIVFLAIIGVCVILWIVCVWLIVGLVDKAVSGNISEILGDLLDSLNVIRISIIISLQFIVASYIAMNVIKYNKTLLPYQILAGIAQLYIDFYFCLFLTAFTITKDGTVWFSDTAVFLTNMWVHALFAIFIVASIFPTMVFRRVDRRRLLTAGKPKDDIHEETKKGKEPEAVDHKPEDEPIAEKLRKLKSLLDEGLITQEEYDKKREEILNSI